MKQEDKNLLLKDLCARLPYGLICNINGEDVTIGFIGSITGEIFPNKSGIGFSIYENTIKPYLRPISSMTEKEKKECFNRTMTIDIVKTSKEIIDYCLSHHFDYRGLIEKGLAIAVTKENNPYKE